MKNSQGEVVWNLGIEKIRENIFKLHMPDENGILPDSFKSVKEGFQVSWPVNPHFTGESGICNILWGTDKFKEAAFQTQYGIERR